MAKYKIPIQIKIDMVQMFIGPINLWEKEYFQPDLSGRLVTRNHVEEKSTSWDFSFANTTLPIYLHLKI